MTSIYSQSWDQYSAVRSRKPIQFKKDSKFPLFPEELQPLCNHPLISKYGNAGKDYILTQICYKYLQEICITETDVVNPTCLNIAYGNSPVELDENTKADAFTIIVDEAFHSYVAKNFMLQIREHTGIEPLHYPRANELTKAIKKIADLIPTDLYYDFELVATCISENIFTDEIIEVSRFKNVNESFHQVMVDHASDEGRHAGYFIKIMRAYWEQIDSKKKDFFATVIPKFIQYCLDGHHDAECLTLLLSTHGLTLDEINTVLSVNNNEVTAASRQARMKNITRFLKRTSVLDYEPIAQSFAE